MSDGVKFTPGPWVARIQMDRGRKDLGWIVEHGNGRICWASLAYADTNTEATAEDPAREANARLIAAAPALYEALKEILVIDDDHDLFDRMDCDVIGPVKDYSPRLLAAINKARAALKSAEVSQ